MHWHSSDHTFERTVQKKKKEKNIISIHRKMERGGSSDEQQEEHKKKYKKKTQEEVRYGNLHTFPKPTAYPMVANMNCSFESQLSVVVALWPEVGLLVRRHHVHRHAALSDGTHVAHIKAMLVDPYPGLASPLSPIRRLASLAVPSSRQRAVLPLSSVYSVQWLVGPRLDLGSSRYEGPEQYEGPRYEGPDHLSSSML
ncbi:hypothetical protein CEXT_255731 [Caerostris extrusa]|uniref:Uncharacterized protein n=1 Tax=Caerostris extrusa TaxID=172846 RepID=A0AAV4XIP0_CAEEX|nr:hypothetical protein CEXT_255731 [Caerostris extrusa]